MESSKGRAGRKSGKEGTELALPAELMESFVAEMNGRRQRLKYWMRLIHAATQEMEAGGGQTGKANHRCRRLASGLGGARKSGAPAAASLRTPRALR